jgi:hypothetical protein
MLDIQALIYTLRNHHRSKSIFTLGPATARSPLETGAARVLMSRRGKCITILNAVQPVPVVLATCTLEIVTALTLQYIDLLHLNQLTVNV